MKLLQYRLVPLPLQEAHDRTPRVPLEWLFDEELHFLAKLARSLLGWTSSSSAASVVPVLLTALRECAQGWCDALDAQGALRHHDANDEFHKHRGDGAAVLLCMGRVAYHGGVWLPCWDSALNLHAAPRWFSALTRRLWSVGPRAQPGYCRFVDLTFTAMQQWLSMRTEDPYASSLLALWSSAYACGCSPLRDVEGYTVPAAIGGVGVALRGGGAGDRAQQRLLQQQVDAGLASAAVTLASLCDPQDDDIFALRTADDPMDDEGDAAAAAFDASRAMPDALEIPREWMEMQLCDV